MQVKRIILFVLLSIAAVSASAQTNDNTKNTTASPDQNVNFRLFQTRNMWNFLKLDTRTGIIDQVQYSTEGKAMQYPLNTTALAEGDDAKPGRFFLYPTENSYNFILLDQIDGRVWQVQWNIDKDSRGIWRIFWYPD